MRKPALGMSFALFAGLALAACGNEPEPIAPVGPAFDRTTESTDTDASDGSLPDVTLPETEAVPPVGSQPGEIPEVMEPETAPGMPGGDATNETIVDPGATPEELSDESGTPQ